METKNLAEIINTSKSKNEILLKYFGYNNKRVYNKLNNFIVKNNINISHLEKKTKYCLCCNNIIKINNKFCNSSCAASFNNKKRKMSDETKNLIRNKLKGRKQTEEQINKVCDEKNDKYVKDSITERKCSYCGNEYIVKRRPNGKLSKSKYCSKKCQDTQSSILMKEKAKCGILKGWSSRNIVSYPEQFFIGVLNNNNIEYVHNYPVNKRSLGLNNACNYFLDFYIKEKNIDLEIDGKQHKNRVEYDNFRDNILTKNGYIVYRINWKNINNDSGKEYMENEINKFLNFYKNI